MRLLNVDSFEFTDFQDSERPSYAVASHRWNDEEPTFQDVRDRNRTSRKGYAKVEGFARYLREQLPSIKWLWIDTCCINKESAAELSEAINSMFEWYGSATLCLAYIADVKAADDIGTFRASEWFRRGWTLQELLAPQAVLFLTKSWQIIGHKGRFRGQITAGPNLQRTISEITGINEGVLHDYAASNGLSAEEKMKWMDGRMTSREEDMFYALFGILSVTIGANYGEKSAGARERLLAAIKQRTHKTMDHREQCRRITKWLSPPDPWTSHEAARDKHEHKTGEWLLKHNRYLGWKLGSTKTLWIHGKAGCGKTILCSTAIEDVRAHCQDALNTGHAVFYFTFSDDHKQTYQDLILSLVAQLALNDPGLSLLTQEYEKSERKLPRLDTLQKILRSSISAYDEVYLQLDALDECPETDGMRQMALTGLGWLMRNVSNVRLLVTSRDVPDVRSSLQELGTKSFSISARNVDADIQKFRWAQCQLQTLKESKSTRPKTVRAVLLSLPKTLDETYERILRDIGEDDRPYALTLLRWIAYARSPRTLKELAEASIIDPTDQSESQRTGLVDIANRGGWGDTLDILAGLIVTESPGAEDRRVKLGKWGSERLRSTMSFAGEHDEHSRIRLAHFSVKEYLESPRILAGGAKYYHLSPGKEHGYLMQSCLTYLIYYSRSSAKTSNTDDLEMFPLLRYCANFWYHHAGLQGEDSDMSPAMLLLTTEDLKRDWLLVHNPDYNFHDMRHYFDLEAHEEEPFNVRINRDATALYYASLCGLKPVVRELLSTGSNVDASGGYLETSLNAASAQGDEKLVKILLDAGADVKTQGSRHNFRGTALHLAAARCAREVVRILIDAGADVNAPESLWGTPLGAVRKSRERDFEASFAGDVVKMLVGAGADFNLADEDGNNWLRAVSYHGDVDIVETLLEVGADVNAHQDPMNVTALQLASDRGHTGVVSKLLEAGADVRMRGKFYGDALQNAARNGHKATSLLLIKRGADVNASTTGYNSSALQGAAWGGHEDVVQMLIDCGANVNASGGEDGTPLIAASGEGHLGVVQILLSAGVDVYGRGGHYGSALEAATRRRHKTVEEVLINARAKRGPQPTVLEQAASGSQAFKRMLSAVSLSPFESIKRQWTMSTHN